MAEHFSGLSPAEIERLALFIEECGEAIQAACKVLRHGYSSVNPDDEAAGDNQTQLAKEIGHLMHAADLLAGRDISPSAIVRAQKQKAASIGRWLHHQGSE